MKDNRSVYFGLGALVALVAFFLGHLSSDMTIAQNTPMVFDEIQVQKLRVIDDAGNTVILLKANPTGGVVGVYDTNGKTCAGLSVDKDGGGALTVFNKNGELGVDLSTNENGGSVRVGDKKGKLGIALDTNENGGSVSVYGNLGKGGISLSIDSADGSGVVGVHALNGTGRYFRRW